MSARVRKEKIEGCCSYFTQHINKKCDDHGFECPDSVVRLYCHSRGTVNFGLQHPDKISHYLINFCPWCGTNLEAVEKSAVQPE